MAEQQNDQAPPFDEQYRPLLKAVFAEIAAAEVQGGADPAARAADYAARGKPDFVLAFVLASALPDAEKRAIFAQAYERRASATEQRATQFERQFHRPFPLLGTEAAKDRATARQIRAGHAPGRGVGRQLPLL